MKTTSKLIAAAVLASSLIASSAYAGNEMGRQRLAERNADYFQQNGRTASASSSSYEASNSDVSPQHRMGQRNAEYFAGKTSDTGSQPTAAKTVAHPKKH